MNPRSSLSRWRSLFSSGGPREEDREFRVVDPTNELLEQLNDLESRIPWIPLGLALLVLLWIPSVVHIRTAEFTPAESVWLKETVFGDAAPAEAGGTEFSRLLTRTAWQTSTFPAWTPDMPVAGLGAPAGPEDLGPADRLAVRIPSAAAYLAGIVIFFALARLVIGNAGGLLAAALLTICLPWIRAGTMAIPLLVGETLVLLGVVTAVVLQARHREVEVAGVTASRMGLAGGCLGVGLLLAPAGFATFVATLLIWFFLALRRSRSVATTLPVENPRETVFFAVFGSIVLVAVSAAVAWGVERLAGGTSGTLVSLLVPTLDGGVTIWHELYRGILSPGRATDLILFVAIPLIIVVRLLEWWDGKPWRAAGLLPWVFLGLYFYALHREAEAGLELAVPTTVPPLFVLGLGWIVLRGLRPGRSRRQEYTFLIAWIAAGVILAPFVPRRYAGDSELATLAMSVALLPAVILIASRAGRALWESGEAVLARTGVLIIVYLPVVVFGVVALRALAPFRSAADLVESSATWVLLLAVALGILSEVIHVRPDAARPAIAPRSHRRVRRGKPRGDRRRTTRRPGRSEQRRRGPKGPTKR